METAGEKFFSAVTVGCVRSSGAFAPTRLKVAALMWVIGINPYQHPNRSSAPILPNRFSKHSANLVRGIRGEAELRPVALAAGDLIAVGVQAEDVLPGDLDALRC
jgi:hypothetical protein